MSDLSHLTDEELQEYHRLYKKMTDESGRAEGVKINSFDLKFAYHIIRLLSEAEQILATGDLDLQEKGRREHMKAIRKGEVPENQIRQWASEKELQLEELYHKSTLPFKPNTEAIRQLLMQCLEEHYGSLSGVIQQVGWAEQVLREIDQNLDKVRKQLYGN